MLKNFCLVSSSASSYLCIAPGIEFVISLSLCYCFKILFVTINKTLITTLTKLIHEWIFWQNKEYCFSIIPFQTYSTLIRIQHTTQFCSSKNWNKDPIHYLSLTLCPANSCRSPHDTCMLDALILTPQKACSHRCMVSVRVHFSSSHPSSYACSGRCVLSTQLRWENTPEKWNFQSNAYSPFGHPNLPIGFK